MRVLTTTFRPLKVFSNYRIKAQTIAWTEFDCKKNVSIGDALKEEAFYFGFQFVPKGVKVFFEPRTLKKEVINSFHTLFANKASCSSGISDPGNTAIKTEIPHEHGAD